MGFGGVAEPAATVGAEWDGFLIAAKLARVAFKPLYTGVSQGTPDRSLASQNHKLARHHHRIRADDGKSQGDHFVEFQQPAPSRTSGSRKRRYSKLTF